jgi:hypothetical protein
MMSRIKYHLVRAKSIPFHIFCIEVFVKLRRVMERFTKKLIDMDHSTYHRSDIQLHEEPLIDLALIQKCSETSSVLNYLMKMYKEHRFDLLGSGWVSVGHQAKAIGVEGFKYDCNITFDIAKVVNKANLKESMSLLSHIDNSYKFIDWQKDFKCGYRWDQKKYYTDQKGEELPGVDIKVPWELGRLQHLPQMAYVALIDATQSKTLLREFKNQVLDFIATNPPRFGVQWVCTMNVGIRVANMVLAYEMMQKADDYNILDDDFKMYFARSVYEHGEHIVNNLEYSKSLTSNHYLSNIAGLLFAAATLASNDKVDQWLGFAVQEIIGEMNKQFNEDGSNAESSTSYHRLCSEIMVYASALIIGLKSEKLNALKQYSTRHWHVQPILRKYAEQDYRIVEDQIILPSWYINKLYNSARFTLSITKPTGEVTQVGDNDSGRFVKLSPTGVMMTSKDACSKYENLMAYHQNDEQYWDENILDHHTLIAAMSGLFSEDIFETKFPIERQIIELLSKGRTLVPSVQEQNTHPEHNPIFNDLTYHSKKTFFTKLSTDSALTDNLKITVYPDSGIYIFNSPRVYLLISAGPNGQKGNGGHAHNDKLSFELNIDGEDVVVDPGTYLYTPLPEMRNKFRSVQAHNTLIIENEEQNEWSSGRYGLFQMENQSECYFLDMGRDYIDVGVKYRDVRVRRRFSVKEDRVLIESRCNRPFHEFFNKGELFSNGYGKKVRMVQK